MDVSQRASLAKAFSKARESALRSDTATFLGTTAPNEVNQMVALLGTKVERPAFRKVLQFVMEYMKGTELNDQHWTQLKEATGVAPAAIATTFAGLLALLKKATRSRIEEEAFKHDCLEVLKVPTEFCADLVRFLSNWCVLFLRLRKAIRAYSMLSCSG